MTELVKLFMQAQLSVRSLQKSFPISSSLAEVHVLIALEKEPLSPSKIADTLNLTRSKVSRILQNLEKSKLIKKLVVKEDQRSSKIKLLKKGISELALADRQLNARTTSWTSKLTKKELQILEDFLRQLADTLGASPEKTRASENPIRAQQRRVARAGGLLGQKLMKTDLKLQDYHIMLLLSESNTALTMDDLFSLPFDKAILSRISDMLERSAWITKSLDPEDRRRTLVLTTAKGLTEFNRINSQLAKIFDSVKVSPAIAKILEKIPSFIAKNERLTGS